MSACRQDDSAMHDLSDACLTSNISCNCVRPWMCMLHVGTGSLAWIPGTSRIINVFIIPDWDRGHLSVFSCIFTEILVFPAYLTCVLTSHCASLLSLMADSSEGLSSSPISLQCTVSVYCPTFNQREDLQRAWLSFFFYPTLYTGSFIETSAVHRQTHSIK